MLNKKKDRIATAIQKLVSKIKVQNLLILLSILIGIFAALLAIVLKITVHNIEDLLQLNFQKQYENYLYFLYPAIGILLTLFYIQIFRGGIFVKGLSGLIFSVYKKSGSMPPHKMYSHMITSAVTVGFGGSVGLEAPIVLTGAATGSNVAKFFKLGQNEKILMLACGVSAGIAAIFNCPIAAVIFSFEVLLSEVKVPAFIPLIIASATATVVSKLLYGGQLFFLVINGWDMAALPYYVLLGVVCGLISAYMINVNCHIENIFKSSKKTIKKAIIGGAFLGILIFIFPPLFGEGYKSIQHLLEGNYEYLFNNSIFYGLNHPWLIIFYILLIILLKIIATSVTIGSGGNGGIFAPSLFTGAMTGFLVSHSVNLSEITHLNETNFVAVGMAGILSGVVHAPLTGIFLIAEITGGYALFVPLMIVSAISYFIGKYFEPYSVYTKELARKGKWKGYDKDSYILTQIKVKDLIEKDFIPINKNHSFRKLTEAVAESKRNIFPVVDDMGKFEGIISLDDIRVSMFDTDLYDTAFVKDYVHAPAAVIDIHEEMYEVMKKFEHFNSWNLPVTDEGKYIGFISKSRIFNLYREHLVEQSKEVF